MAGVYVSGQIVVYMTVTKLQITDSTSMSVQN